MNFVNLKQATVDMKPMCRTFYNYNEGKVFKNQLKYFAIS